MLAGDGNSVRDSVLALLFAALVGLVGVVALLVSRHVEIPAFLLPPMAMPGPLPPGYAPATPIGNPGMWFSNDDYPADARRARDEGRVTVAIAIDARGRPRGCELTGSSGHASLDRVTCQLVMRRARYVPARAPDGTPVAARVTIPGVRWRLEE